jgi:hypothetical protein
MVTYSKKTYAAIMQRSKKKIKTHVIYTGIVYNYNIAHTYIKNIM